MISTMMQQSAALNNRMAPWVRAAVHHVAEPPIPTHDHPRMVPDGRWC